MDTVMYFDWDARRCTGDAGMTRFYDQWNSFLATLPPNVVDGKPALDYVHTLRRTVGVSGMYQFKATVVVKQALEPEQKPYEVRVQLVTFVADMTNI